MSIIHKIELVQVYHHHQQLVPNLVLPILFLQNIFKYCKFEFGHDDHILVLLNALFDLMFVLFTLINSLIKFKINSKPQQSSRLTNEKHFVSHYVGNIILSYNFMVLKKVHTKFYYVQLTRFLLCPNIVKTACIRTIIQYFYHHQ